MILILCVSRPAPAPPPRAPDSPEFSPELPPGAPGLAGPASWGQASHLLAERPPRIRVPNIQVREIIFSPTLNLTRRWYNIPKIIYIFFILRKSYYGVKYLYHVSFICIHTWKKEWRFTYFNFYRCLLFCVGIIVKVPGECLKFLESNQSDPINSEKRRAGWVGRGSHSCCGPSLYSPGLG